jgi:hypothetical protein
MTDGRVVAPCAHCQLVWGDNVLSFHALTGGVEYEPGVPTLDVAQDCIHCGRTTIIPGPRPEAI